MKRMLLLIASLPALVRGTQCTASPTALARLTSYLSYESTVGRITTGQHRFGFATTDAEDLFLQYEIPARFDQSSRLAYVVAKGKRMFVTPCPADSKWTQCAQESFQSFYGRESPNQRILPVERTCDLFVTVPKWRPSPNDAQKKKLGSEVLEEFVKFGYHQAKEIYVRDFNINDPELDFYAISANGEQSVHGCDFSSEYTPHCEWHKFGQVPIEQIRKGIMARPYRLFPEN